MDVATLPRVADRLAEGAGGIHRGVVAHRRNGGRAGPPGAGGRGSTASVPLECQRCLQAFAWPVAQRHALLLARDERELARLDADDDAHEVILAAAPLDPLTLVEDELLLTLPFAPRCERPECAGTRCARAIRTRRGRPRLPRWPA